MPKYGSIKEALADFNSQLEKMEGQYERGPGLLLREHDHPRAPKKEELKESVQPEKKAKVVAENATRYSNPKSAMDSFRVLAGLEEREIMPWNPGVVGSTKSNLQIMEEAGALDSMMGATDDGADAAYAGAEKMHQMVLNRHLQQHATLHELPPEHQAQAMAKMGKERQQLADVLRTHSGHAGQRGHENASARMAQLSQKHGEAANAYAQGQLPREDEEDAALTRQ